MLILEGVWQRLDPMSDRLAQSGKLLDNTLCVRRKEVRRLKKRGVSTQALVRVQLWSYTANPKMVRSKFYAKTWRAKNTP
jgi:hypothetical protein